MATIGGPVIPGVTDGLVLYLDAANEDSYPGTGTVWRDLSKNNYTGSLVNGPVYSGRSKSSNFSFDGSNDYFTLGTRNLISTDYTINIWFNCNTITTKEHFLVSLGYSNSNSVLFTTYTNLGGNLALNCYYNVGGSVTGRQIYQPVLSNTSTINLSFTRNSGLNTPYVNGIIQDTKTFTENVTLGNHIYDLGYATQRNKTTAYMQGNIYIFSLYNRALTAAEVLRNYNSLKSRFNL